MIVKYNLSLRLLHWIMAILIISLIFIGFFMVSASDALKPTLYSLHKATGITVLALIVLRLSIRLFSINPPLPTNSNYMLNFIARLVHWLLYLFMFIMPMSGYIMSSASQRHFTWFFDLDVPLLVGQNMTLAMNAHSIHVVSAYIITSLIALHLLGTIKHLVIDKINILKRIW